MKTQTTAKNSTAPTLTKIPRRPSDQRRGGSGSPLTRLMIRQVKEIIYVARRALTARDPIALNAAVDPILISERRQVMTKVINTAFKGMFHPGLT